MGLIHSRASKKNNKAQATLAKAEAKLVKVQTRTARVEATAVEGQTRLERFTDKVDASRARMEAERLEAAPRLSFKEQVAANRAEIRAKKAARSK